MYVFIHKKFSLSSNCSSKWKVFVNLTEQWSITYKLIWRNIQLDIKKCFTYEYVKTCLNKFNMYILSELENMLHVVHVVLVLLPLLSVFFFEIQKVQIDPSKVTPCSPNQILSSFLYISYHLTTKNQLQIMLWKWRQQLSYSYEIRSKVADQKTSNFYYCISLLVKEYAALF